METNWRHNSLKSCLGQVARTCPLFFFASLLKNYPQNTSQGTTDEADKEFLGQGDK